MANNPKKNGTIKRQKNDHCVGMSFMRSMGNIKGMVGMGIAYFVLHYQRFVLVGMRGIISRSSMKSMTGM